MFLTQSQSKTCAVAGKEFTLLRGKRVTSALRWVTAPRSGIYALVRRAMGTCLGLRHLRLGK